MITADKIILDQNNIKAFNNYIEWSTQLNRYIKDCFGKKVRTNMLCISPILEDLHKENDIISGRIAEYCRRNSKVLGVGKYYKLKSLDKYRDKCELIHIISKVSDKHFNIEQLEVYKSNGYFNVKGRLVETNNPMNKTSILQYVDYFYNGLLVEVSEDEWNRYKELYIAANNFEL